MRRFPAEVMRCEVCHEIADNWIEFRVGSDDRSPGASDRSTRRLPPRRRES